MPDPVEIKSLKETKNPNEGPLEIIPLTSDQLGWWVTEAEIWSQEDHHVLTRKFYDTFGPRLKALKVLGEVDEGLLTRYCETLSHWLKVKTFIAKHGTCHPVYDFYYERDAEGRDVMKKTLKHMKEFPQFQQYIRIETQLRKFEEELGIGAATRTRISKVARTATEIEKNATSEVRNSPSHPFDYATRRKAA